MLNLLRCSRRLIAPRGLRAFTLAAAVLVLSGALALQAQNTPTKVLDASSLKPPPGAKIAIVEFDDLECPACAHANPIIKGAAAQYKIPWVRHDFLIPGHLWSPQAALFARWFDTKSKALGDEYRDEVFANQMYIYNPDVLRQFTEKYAQSHGTALPFAIDPTGKLNSEIQADTDVGRRLGIQRTPTIFIVTARANGNNGYLEVVDPDHDLYRTIDQAEAQLKH